MFLTKISIYKCNAIRKKSKSSKIWPQKFKIKKVDSSYLDPAWIYMCENQCSGPHVEYDTENIQQIKMKIIVLWVLNHVIKQIISFSYSMNDQESYINHLVII